MHCSFIVVPWLHYILLHQRFCDTSEYSIFLYKMSPRKMLHCFKKILCYILPDMDLHKGCSYVKKKKSKGQKKKKDPGRIISTELSTDDYSQASSHYRLARDLLPAAFRPWAGSVLIMQPGRSCGLLRSAHIDARLSAGARST